MDNLISKVYFYKGLIYERLGQLNSLVGEFYEVYRAAASRDDQQTQATVLNLIL